MNKNFEGTTNTKTNKTNKQTFLIIDKKSNQSLIFADKSSVFMKLAVTYTNAGPYAPVTSVFGAKT